MKLSRTNEITMVIVTRKDLQLSKGNLQHRSATLSWNVHSKQIELFKDSRKLQERRVEKDSGRGKDVDEMKRLYGAISSVGIVCHLVKDAGHTEIPPGTVTVLGIGPAPRDSVDAFTGDLQLV